MHVNCYLTKHIYTIYWKNYFQKIRLKEFYIRMSSEIFRLRQFGPMYILSTNNSYLTRCIFKLTIQKWLILLTHLPYKVLPTTSQKLNKHTQATLSWCACEMEAKNIIYEKDNKGSFELGNFILLLSLWRQKRYTSRQREKPWDMLLYKNIFLFLLRDKENYHSSLIYLFLFRRTFHILQVHQSLCQQLFSTTCRLDVL